MTNKDRDQVNCYIPSMLISVLGSSEVLNSALSLKSEFLNSLHPTRARRLDSTIQVVHKEEMLHLFELGGEEGDPPSSVLGL